MRLKCNKVLIYAKLDGANQLELNPWSPTRKHVCRESVVHSDRKNTISLKP